MALGPTRQYIQTECKVYNRAPPSRTINQIKKKKKKKKLQKKEGTDIAKIAIEHGLYEEALTIYKKYDQHALAINVLVEHIVSIDRGLEYATKVNEPAVWGRLAKAQLDGPSLWIKDSIGMKL
jgi:hypothetical protein